MNKLFEKEIIEEIETLANKYESGSEKEILIDLANYISKIMGNEDSRYEVRDNELPSIIKQRINEARQNEGLSTGDTEKILGIVDQLGAKYIEVFRVCFDYDHPHHASPHSLTISRDR